MNSIHLPFVRTMRLSIAFGVMILMIGCSSFRADEPPDPGNEGALTSIAEAARQADASPPDPPPPIARRSVADDVRQLLEAAEEALAADRLTTPMHDNAFDRFQAVLLLRPDNPQAKSGLQQVFSRYVGMVRDALARNRPDTARALVERARLVDSDHPIIQELMADIAAVRERVAEQQDEHEAAEDEREVLLSVQDLDNRDQTVIEKLQTLANEVRDTGETLMIVARNDAEGRWIYQQMNKGVPNYRLRGDIRVGSVPKILLLPPIEQ